MNDFKQYPQLSDLITDRFKRSIEEVASIRFFRDHTSYLDENGKRVFILFEVEITVTFKDGSSDTALLHNDFYRSAEKLIENT